MRILASRRHLGQRRLEHEGAVLVVVVAHGAFLLLAGLAGEFFHLEHAAELSHQTWRVLPIRATLSNTDSVAGVATRVIARTFE